MRIGDAAAAAGTTPRALRFYEECGLLPPPPRSPAGQRRYGPDEVVRVRVIRGLLALGLTVEDLRGISDRIQLLTDEPGRRCAGADAASPASVVVDRRLAVIDAEIDRLSRLRERLAEHTGRA
ncbi:MerR family transcriptional regulator [Streptomyces sp. UH6]|uniref:MerR family transcriptional regulator n=1 Tax=Streptomyces sp. UH6 TaxID=2748379 RepID=UPI0015D4B32A|nr:MerR family transcriptional regulator [Streptomyces sp. UH6]NYV74461.1 MerR family transcriptional regulator [Streptomyces sp. UH6]